MKGLYWHWKGNIRCGAILVLASSLSCAALAQTSGAAATGTMGSAPTEAGGGTPAMPGSLDNQIQSQQNQGGGTGGRGNAVQTRPSTQPIVTPPISGARRDTTTRAKAQAKCDDVLANRDRHSAQEIIACEQASRNNDPAAELDRRLQRENSRAVHSICRGC